MSPQAYLVTLFCGRPSCCTDDEYRQIRSSTLSSRKFYYSHMHNRYLYSVTYIIRIRQINRIQWFSRKHHGLFRPTGKSFSKRFSGFKKATTIFCLFYVGRNVFFLPFSLSVTIEVSCWWGFFLVIVFVVPPWKCNIDRGNSSPVWWMSRRDCSKTPCNFRTFRIIAERINRWSVD